MSIVVLWSTHAERLDDEALLTAMALGDHRAAAVFVRRHQRSVYGLAVTICRDAVLGEDLAQQTFERIWRHAGSFDARRGSVRVWMMTICRRLCIDALRTRRSSPIDPDDMALLMPPTAGDSVGDTATNRVEAAAVHAAMAHLPDDQRRVLMLAAIGGHTLAEIAEREGIPLGTAKTRLRTALRRVREHLLHPEVDHA